MAIETISLQALPLRFSGTFDFATLYQTAKAWFPSQNMGVNWEKLYKDKVSGPGIREVEIEMKGFVKFDQYRRWNATIVLKAWDMKPIQVDGREFCQGRMEVVIDGSLDLDYADMFSKSDSKFVKMLGKLIHHFRKKDEDFVIKRKCEQELYALQTKFKQILQIPA